VDSVGPVALPGVEGAHQDLELLGLLVGVGALLALSPTLRVPLPILLVLGGVVMGFIPGLPEVTLPPEIVLVAVLPPLLYAGAFFTSLRDLRTNRRPILLLALGLVAATMTAVAIVAHAWIGLPWAVAFTLGAIVSPTDALAATEIASRLGAPRRIVSLIEGESLVNDGTALVLYAAAVSAALGGTFSLLDTSGRVVVNVVGGIVVGLAVGWVVRQVRRRLDDPPIEVAIASRCLPKRARFCAASGSTKAPAPRRARRGPPGTWTSRPTPLRPRSTTPTAGTKS